MWLDWVFNTKTYPCSNMFHNTIRIGKFHNQIEILNKMRFFKTKYKKNTLVWSLLWSLPVIHLFDYETSLVSLYWYSASTAGHVMSPWMSIGVHILSGWSATLKHLWTPWNTLAGTDSVGPWCQSGPIWYWAFLSPRDYALEGFMFLQILSNNLCRFMVHFPKFLISQFKSHITLFRCHMS